MFAIEITEENFEKIILRGIIPERNEGILDIYHNSAIAWYFVSGFVDERGRHHDYTVLSKNHLDLNFDYDPVKIQTDWDQIVRKPEGL